jgi:hypothetical protein
MDVVHQQMVVAAVEFKTLAAAAALMLLQIRQHTTVKVCLHQRHHRLPGT